MCLAEACTESDIDAIYSRSMDEIASTGACELTIGDTKDGSGNDISAGASFTTLLMLVLTAGMSAAILN
jgi:hypothetical protein